MVVNEMIMERRISFSTSMSGTLSLEYLTAGTGPTLLLLHGIGDSAYTWQWVMPAFARSYRVIAPSLPGFGASRRPDDGYSPAMFTEYVSAFLDALGLEKVIVVGNSLGGLVGIRLALSSPERVPALVLVDSAGLGREISLLMRLLAISSIGKIVTIWNKTAVGALDWALGMAWFLCAHPTRAPREWVRGLYRMARTSGYLYATISTIRSGCTIKGQRGEEIMLDQLQNLNMPALVVWGSRDRVAPPSHADSAAKQLPNGQLLVIGDCGHVPQVEYPDAFTDVLIRFLKEEAPSAKP